MSTPGIKKLRDYQFDWLVRKQWVPAWDVVKNFATPTGANYAPATLSVGWSFGSPTYSAFGGGHIGGIRFAATTTQVDYLWRIPSDLDKNMPVYIRHHWVPQIGGATPTISINQWYATISAGTVLSVMSPTAPITLQIPASTMVSGTDGTVDFRYQLTPRGAIAPLGTGLQANQTFMDNFEAIHTTFQIVSTNFAIVSNPVFWLGMDFEYTPRMTYGTGSFKEARKMETNLGFMEIGSVNQY